MKAVKASLFALLMGGCCSVFASDMNSAVLEVAQSHQTVQTQVNGGDATVFYVGAFAGCDSVAVMTHQHPANFRVCGNRVEPRNSVAPTWPDEENSRRVLRSVVSNAILYSKAQQTDPNGYVIAAQSLGAVGECKNVQIIISYEGDLVDYAVRQVCR